MEELLVIIIVKLVIVSKNGLCEVQSLPFLKRFDRLID